MKKDTNKYTECLWMGDNKTIIISCDAKIARH